MKIAFINSLGISFLEEVEGYLTILDKTKGPDKFTLPVYSTLGCHSISLTTSQIKLKK